MYRNILVVVNAGATSHVALDEYKRLDPGPNTRVHLLGIASEPPPVLFGDYTSMALMTTEDALGTAQQRMQASLAPDLALLRQAGLDASLRVDVGTPGPIVLRAARELGVDLVIICHSHQKSWAARWWDDIVLIEKLRCSILIVCNPAPPAG